MLHKKDNDFIKAFQPIYNQLAPILSQHIEREQTHITQEELNRCLNSEAIDDIFVRFRQS